MMPGLSQNNNIHNCAAPSATDVPVLIVGGGPAGLLAAFMLSQLQVKTLLIEKYPERLAAPKAHALSPRSLEICRQFGLDTRALRQLGSPRHDAYWVNFVTNLDGEAIGSLPYERMDKEVLEHTSEMIHNIPQPDFEAFVAHELERSPFVEIQKNVAFVRHTQEDGVVTSTLEDRTTKTEFEIRSKFVLACDGAKSQVREDLKITCQGDEGCETMMTIHFKANLRDVVGERVGMLHWIADPACSGFIISYDIGGNQVFINNFDPIRHPVKTWSQELAKSTVLAAIGRDIPVEVLSYRPWLLSRKVAESYVKGNVILVGDAAHSFPPTGGLGLNSGLADAHNIAYKVASVLNGWANPSIINAYERERHPIALVNSAQSVKNGEKIFSFLKALGTAGIDDIERARANLHQSIHDPTKINKIRGEVEAQREHFNNLEIHIGYVYGETKPPPNASNFSPKFSRGARLPHAWIKLRDTAHSKLSQPPVDVSYVKEFDATDIKMRQYSILDLVPFDSISLIVSRRKDWLSRYEHIQTSLSRNNMKIAIWSADEDFEFTQDYHLALYQLHGGLAAGGALLVRPDQHISGCFSLEAQVTDLIAAITEFIAL